MKVVIIDYGAGNVQSVNNALNRLGIEANLSNSAEIITAADRVIFPGVGHAQHAMNEIKRFGLDKVIPHLQQPVLGICLGMQLMCRFSDEGNTECLGIFDETVKRFDIDLKVPHIGWNTATAIQSGQPQFYYFVHSYYVPLNPYTTLTTAYGINFSAAMKKCNFTAMQFHPEKSGPQGEQLLLNFITQENNQQ